jgi:hypothetical protein
MPIKVKKEKKIKQKQKQSQKQIVNIKIGEIKKSARRKASKKPNAKPLIQQSVQPVQYLYQSTGSMPIPQPFQNIGVSRPAQVNILGEKPEVRQPEVRQVQEALQMERGAETRQNILGGGFFPREEIANQRILRLRQPEEPSLYRDFPNPETINPLTDVIEQEVNFEELQPELEIASPGTRRYSRGDGYGTKAQLIDEIMIRNMGYTKKDLKKKNRVALIDILERLKNVKI